MSRFRGEAILEAMGMALPYDVVKTIEAAVQDPEKAEKVIRALEEGLGTIRKEALAQKEVVKAELKDELTKELVTKADLVELKNELQLEISSVREEMARLEAKFEARFGEIDARFTRMEVWLKVIVGVMVAGFTLLNPNFQQLVKTILASIGG